MPPPPPRNVNNTSAAHCARPVFTSLATADGDDANDDSAAAAATTPATGDEQTNVDFTDEDDDLQEFAHISSLAESMSYLTEVDDGNEADGIGCTDIRQSCACAFVGCAATQSNAGRSHACSSQQNRT